MSYNPAADVERLVAFGIARGMMTPLDAPMARNLLLDALHLTQPAEEPENPVDAQDTALPILSRLLDYAVAQGLIENDTETERDLFDTKLMGAMMPRPSEIAAKFQALEASQGIRAACQWFYGLNIESGYIRSDRVARNIAWNHDTTYGTMEITINLSKPEKDPREVARLKTLPQVGYPKCQLCPSNVGYRGRLDHPARQTLRMLPVTLNGESWFFQYSPYVYYPEHCIVLREEHVPMRIRRETFVRLMDFLERFPHYFIGSNAGIPIVGGSILNHDHFQGGAWTMPMSKAAVRHSLRAPVKGLEAGILHWPMSVLRLRHESADALTEEASRLLSLWEAYSDESLGILAHTDSPHNAVTPIARRRGEAWELDFVLRNNRTSAEHPMGIFHVHGDLHHIKKENIGLIEVMGLFILPGRLDAEFRALADILCGSVPYDRAALEDAAHPLNKHLRWLDAMLAEGPSATLDQAMARIQGECSNKCVRVLQDCAVFQDDEAGHAGFLRFAQHAGYGL